MATPAGNVDLSLSFESEGAATPSVVVPSIVQAIGISISGGTLKAPQTQTWHNDGSEQKVALHLAGLAPGTYAITVSLFDQASAVIGSSTGSVSVTSGATRDINMLMIYGEGSGNVTFTASPSS